MTAQPSLPNEVWATFAGPIDQAAVQRILAGLATASLNKVTHLHFLFQSFGGVVGDGICLHNVFHALPFDLTLYNAGSVQSIAVIAYLGAKKRKVSTHATFGIHRSTGGNQPATAAQLKAVAETLRLDDGRTEAILRRHLTLSDTEWQDLDHVDVHFSAPRAVEIGLADEIAEFAPPFGSQLYSI